MKSKKPTGKKRISKVLPKGRGRPTPFRSAEERAEANRKRNRAYQTSEEYKAHRKHRYATDAAYREACQQRAREFALAKRAGAIAEYAALIRQSTRSRASVGKHRTLLDAKGNPKGEALTYSIPECAAVLNRPVYVVREWVNAGRFPSPGQWGKGRTGPAVLVYDDDQVVALAKAAAQHLRTQTAHLTASHTDAITAFHLAMKP